MAIGVGVCPVDPTRSARTTEGPDRVRVVCSPVATHEGL
jgi:hypothetical protein